MKGLELSRLFYLEKGKAFLLEALRSAGLDDARPFWAAGLAGEGSDCFGFDDEISRDHDWGPGFCIWLTDAQYDRYGQVLERAYESLPQTFAGFERVATPLAGQRTGVFRISDFYGHFLGTDRPDEIGMLKWLHMPQHYLAVAVNGEVFEDDCGEFTKIRTQLLKGYPEDVRRKKIAACLARMAREGQYNLPRCRRRGDTVAAALAGAQFMEETMAVYYLLRKRYAPYYKWMYRGLADLEGSDRLVALLDDFARDMNGAKAEEIAGEIIGELYGQDLSGAGGSFLQDHALSVMEHIDDARLRGRHLLEG